MTMTPMKIPTIAAATQHPISIMLPAPNFGFGRSLLRPAFRVSMAFPIL